jgi:hypothetical protein
MTRKRLLAGFALLAAVTAGCGVQPSGVIAGLEAPSGTVQADSGATIYLISQGTVVAAGRGNGQLTVAQRLTVLAGGPTAAEQARGLSTDVPTTAGPFSVKPGVTGLTVVTSTDVTTLSTLAADQLVCTADDTGHQVTLAGNNGSRGPLTCPLPG